MACCLPCPVDSRLRGNDGGGRRNDAWRDPPCGYCLEASMTGWGGVVGDFRFLALLGMTRRQGFVVSPHPVDSRLRGNDGEGRRE